MDRRSPARVPGAARLVRPAGATWAGAQREIDGGGRGHRTAGKTAGDGVLRLDGKGRGAERGNATLHREPRKRAQASGDRCAAGRAEIA